MEARNKIPKTLDPLIVSEHALSRKSTAAISSSIMKPLDVRNTKIYPQRRLVEHSSSCSCKVPSSPSWDFDELFQSNFFLILFYSHKNLRRNEAKSNSQQAVSELPPRQLLRNARSSSPSRGSKQSIGIRLIWSSN